jgi:carbon-monoxide dehydrogenase large subunit
VTGDTGLGIGASLRRKEDARFLRGEGRFVADLRFPDLVEAAFLRSPVAHARLLRIGKPSDAADRVFTMEDLAGVAPIRATSALPGFRASEQWPLARGRVRHVGECIALCLAPTRAEAEDLAERIELELEPLPVIADMLTAADAPTVHEHWPDNVALTTLVHDDLSDLRATAPIQVRRRLRTARQHMAPLEGRGVVARFDPRTGQLEVWSATQLPHVNRTGLAECLGLDEGQVRVISPDVGGGFGYKGILLPEEIALGWLALRLNGRPVRWIEDRFEQLTANANCREHHYDLTAYAAADGTLLGVECDALVDVGAYSSYPFSSCLEAAQVASILPGPYRFRRFHCRARGVATNKPPILPYRGVARAGVCYAMEVTLDAVARAAGISPIEVRLRNLVRPEEMPFTNVTNKWFDSGDYPEAVRRAAARIGAADFAARRTAARAAGRRIGLGFAVFCEQGAHGTSVYHGWGIPMVPGLEQCQARLTPDGVLELRIGAHSHGQGMETTMAQVAHSVLGIHPDRVRLVHGDTALTPYSTGTWGSRSAVLSGGAVAEACTVLAERVLQVGAHLLQQPRDAVRLHAGAVAAPGGGAVTLAEVARTVYRAPQNLPPDMHPGLLEVTQGHRPARDTGTFSYACHACVAEVDIATGVVRLLDYAIAEDAGVMLNPMIVDGQVLGGTAQGIGTALYEEMPFDAAGQPLAATLADYLLPGFTEVPDVAIEHLVTPSPISRFGQKGIGESGAIGPPAAIANAVNDALAEFGAEVLELPITPARVLAALRR